MKNIHVIQNQLYIIDNNEKVNQNGIWAKCSFTGDVLKNRNGQYAYKVILTTNDLLIKDGVQAIPDDFLEWFVKNPSCEFVEIEDVYFHGNGYYKASELSESQKIQFAFMKSYKIITPKEEPKQGPCNNCNNEVCCCIIKKQETLEEAGERLYPNRESFLHRFKNIERIAFTTGAKWQQEQDKKMYSEEEAGELVYNIIGEYSKQYGIMIDGAKLNDLFEQFKKK